MIYAYDYKSIRGEVDWCHYIIISQKFLCNVLVTLADCEETLVSIWPFVVHLISSAYV